MVVNGTGWIRVPGRVFAAVQQMFPQVAASHAAVALPATTCGTGTARSSTFCESDSEAGVSRLCIVLVCSLYVPTRPRRPRNRCAAPSGLPGRGGRWAAEQGCQTACKPGSVPAPQGSAAGRAMAIHLGRPLPGASRDRPGRRRGNPLAGGHPKVAHRPAVPIWSCSRWGLPCRPRCRERGAPLPHPFALTGRPGLSARPRPAVCFLWHFPWGRPRRALPGTVFPWSPDFPPPPGRNRATAAIRPSGIHLS